MRVHLGHAWIASGVLIGALVCACGDDGKPKGSVCERLQNSLCDRTTTCAIDAGITHEESRTAFQARCLSALGSDLMCSEPIDRSGDFELCSANLQEIPCDVVVSFLNQGEVVAPTSSCSDFFAF